MYSTLNGAKDCAKSLRRLFDDSGFIYPLNKCQAAVARAGGYRDWHDLEASLRDRVPRLVDPSAYRRRLQAALPYPCQSPLQAWLDGETDPEENRSDPLNARHWYRDAWPFEWAIMILHRSRTQLLRPGSGRGQRLRANLVEGLLLNLHGGHRAHPRLDPETLALVFKGDFASLFRSDAEHPNFEREFARLVEAGILDWKDGVLRVLPPSGGDVIAEVQADRAEMVEHWAEDGEHPQEQIRSLRDALAYLGIGDAQRVAKAVVEQGSKAHTTPSGPILTVLSDLADQGRPDAVARAYGLFATVRPANAAFVRDSVPAKIASRYLCGALKLSPRSLTTWAERNPDWATQLSSSLSEPTAFSQRVAEMADQIAATST